MTDSPSLLAAVIGREDSAAFGSDNREESRWIGKPWRRVELLTHRFFYKGAEVGRSRDLTFHIGFRRIGIGFTFSVCKTDVLDYSEDRQ